MFSLDDMSDVAPVQRFGEIGDIDQFLDSWIAEEQRIPIVPCDSPIEDIFLWEFYKVANDDVQLRRQHRCNTSAGAFRLDFVLSSVRD